MFLIYKGNIPFLVLIMFKKTPFRIALVILLKVIFIFLQVASLWIIIGWINENVSERIQTLFFCADIKSYVYPIASSFCLFFSSLASAASRKLSIVSINKLINYICLIDKNSDINNSSYKSLVKLLLSIIDSFVPAIFIFIVCLLWVFYFPILAPAIFFFVSLVLLYMKKTVKYSVNVVGRDNNGLKNAGYIFSEDHKRLSNLLMLPMYINIATYSIISVFIFFMAFLFKNCENSTSGFHLLMILSVLAVIRLKSFVSVVVKIGAYYQSVSRIIKLLRTEFV